MKLLVYGIIRWTVGACRLPDLRLSTLSISAFTGSLGQGVSAA